MIRVPVCAYSTMQRDPVSGRNISDVEVIVCNDGTAWTLTEDPDTKVLAWTQDGVPPIPGTYAALGQPERARLAAG